MSEIFVPGTVNFQRKIRCPGHYLIPPDIDIYKYEPIKAMRNVSPGFVKEFNLRKMRRVKDALGRPVIDWNKVKRFRDIGRIKQPWITAAFAIEHIWDPKSALCQWCKKPCRRGMGIIREMDIRRLSG
jgi:hypothetical protein